jgi:hypothetical protein
MAIADEYVLARLESMESSMKAFTETFKEKEEARAQLQAAREQALINSIFKAVREAMAENLPALRGEFDASIKLLSGRCDELDKQVDRVHAEVVQCPDREEFERLVKKEETDRHEGEVALDRVVARLETEIDSEIRGENGLEPRVRALEAGPRNRSLAWKLAIGGALATATPDLVIKAVELFKTIGHKAHP